MTVRSIGVMQTPFEVFALEPLADRLGVEFEVRVNRFGDQFIQSSEMPDSVPEPPEGGTPNPPGVSAAFRTSRGGMCREVFSLPYLFLGWVDDFDLDDVLTGEQFPINGEIAFHHALGRKRLFDPTSPLVSHLSSPLGVAEQTPDRDRQRLGIARFDQ